MINELYQLASTLDDVEIDQEIWHREYLNLPKVSEKNPCYCVMVDQGRVCKVFSLNPDEAAGVRKFGNNQATFPAVNACPLYRITDEAVKKKIEEIKKNPQALNVNEIKGWCTQKNFNWNAKLYRKLKLSINSIPGNILQVIGNQEGYAKDLLGNLIDSLRKFASEDGFYEFHNQLRDYALHNLEEHILVSESLNLLFHGGNKDKDADKDTSKNIIVFDLYNGNLAHLPVIATSKFTHDLNKLLVSGEYKKDSEKEIVTTDAFNDGYAPSDDPMPQVKMPGFDMSIYTMFKGQPCQNRYGNFDCNPVVSYPLSGKNRIRLKQAVEWIGKPDNEGKTWMIIGPNQLLLCYPSQMPNISLDLLEVFGNAGKINEKRFLERAKILIKQLKTLQTDDKPNFINVFVINKIDKARTKVLISNQYSLEQLESSISNWVLGCQNLPLFSPLLKIKEIYPMQLPIILNTVWKTQGNIDSDKSQMTIMKRYEGISFFFENSNFNKNQYLLRAILNHISTFSVYAGNVLHGSVKKVSESLIGDVSNIISSIALLLYRCGERKENYMKGLPYQLGQLMKISDDLHTFYCKIVRNGDVPPRLAGASLYVSASETPVKALAQLSVRMLPYITWAKSFQYKKDDGNSEHGLARWYVNMYEQILSQLSDKLRENITFNDYDKAELFIGYMAAYPKKDNLNKEESQNGK